jgi:hypothetical protein
MSFANLYRGLVLIVGCSLFIGCSDTAPAKSSLDSMSDEEKSKVMQKTIQDTTQKNLDAMKQQGMMDQTPPPGSDPSKGGFQPPESMKKYMKGQGGGSGGSGTSTPPGSGDAEQKK